MLRHVITMFSTGTICGILMSEQIQEMSDQNPFIHTLYLNNFVGFFETLYYTQETYQALVKCSRLFTMWMLC